MFRFPDAHKAYIRNQNRVLQSTHIKKRQLHHCSERACGQAVPGSIKVVLAPHMEGLLKW